MAFVTKAQLRDKASLTRVRKANRTSDSILNEEVAASSKLTNFDVFLSHSFSDRDLVLGAKKAIEEQRLTVYIDWLEDRQLDRRAVSPQTANVLRERMKQCRALVYAHTLNTASSKWCPWELGYFDALKQKVYILPVVDNPTDMFPEQEYIGLYPYLSENLGELKVMPLGERVTATVNRLTTMDSLRKRALS